MHDSSTKMVSLAHALGEALGKDSTKYEEAMAQRLEQESLESLPSDALPPSLDLKDGSFPYVLRRQVGTVFVGTQDHFDWAERNGEYPHKLTTDAAHYYIREESWNVRYDGPLNPAAVQNIKEYRKELARQRAYIEDEGIDLDWEEDVVPLKRDERKDRRRRDKMKTLQRKRQRERKIVYRSGDNEVPVFGYDDDWEE
jgi:hypothetical protein